VKIDPERVIELVRAAQAGERLAFEELEQGYLRPCFSNYFRGRGLTMRGIWEDAVQIATIRVWSSIPRIEDPQAFFKYANVIARKVLVDRCGKEVFRKDWTENLVELDALPVEIDEHALQFPDSATIWEREWFVRQVDEWFERLPDGRVYQDYMMDEITYIEGAELTNTNPAAFRMREHRIRKALRRTATAWRASAA
jgi:RNA polymerase sigma factor (sigma-70 family)